MKKTEKNNLISRVKSLVRDFERSSRPNSMVTLQYHLRIITDILSLFKEQCLSVDGKVEQDGEMFILMNEIEILRKSLDSRYWNSMSKHLTNQIDPEELAFLLADQRHWEKNYPHVKKHKL